MKSIVVAYDRNRGIGASGDLLWQRDLPADLRHFKELTTGHAIIMGRKTYESIGRPLPNRRNIVVSRSMEPVEGVEVAHDLESAFTLAGDNAFVIGGGQIYAESLPFVDMVCATEVDAEFPQATVFFPELPERFNEVSREHHEGDEANKYAWDFVEHKRF